MHGSLMCGAYKSYIGRATPAQADCPFSCCISPSRPQIISHLFLTCPVAATVTNWLCRLWQAMTGYLPVVSVAGLLAADTSSEQLPSDALLQIWHRLRLAVLHSIWTASQIAQASQPTQPSDTSEPNAILASSPSSQQASLSSSSASRHGHLARQLALKTVKAMIHHDWTKCNDNIKQISGVCSSWLRGKDPSMTLFFVFFLFFVFWVGELFITPTWTCNERNHKCQTEGHPQPKLQANLTTWVEADTKVCKEATCQAKQAAHKAVVHQPTAKPVHFQETKHHLCPNQPNIAVKITSIMSMASNARKGQVKCPGAKTTSHDGRAGHVMTHMCHPSKASRMASVTIQVHPGNWHSALAG